MDERENNLTRYSLLLDYMNAMEKGGRGWGSDYENTLCDNMTELEKWPYLAGHYSMLLRQVLNMIPTTCIREGAERDKL